MKATLLAHFSVLVFRILVLLFSEDLNALMYFFFRTAGNVNFS